MELSIIIVNWNSKHYIKKCLCSIRRTCFDLSPQVVVVDGGSFDGCGEMLALEFPEVEFVQCQENIGFGRSNNLGFGKVTGDALLLLNPDTELRPGAVEILLANLCQLPTVGVIGACLLNPDESLQLTSVHPLPTALNAALDSNWKRRRWWCRNGDASGVDAQEVEAVSGACMMLHASTFRRLGGFDPRYFMYAEDMDLCFRIHKLGLKIYHAPQAHVIHHGGGSSRAQFSELSVVMLRESLRLYLFINHGAFQAGLYQILMATSAGLRMILLAVGNLSATGLHRAERRMSILKWWTVMRWSLGMQACEKMDFFNPCQSADRQRKNEAAKPHPFSS